MNRATNYNYWDPQWRLKPGAPFDLIRLTAVWCFLAWKESVRRGPVHTGSPSLHRAGIERPQPAPGSRPCRPASNTPYPSPPSGQCQNQHPRGANPFLMHCAQEPVTLSPMWGLDTVVSLDPCIPTSNHRPDKSSGTDFKANTEQSHLWFIPKRGPFLVM